MFHFQKCGQNEFSLPSELEAMFGEMILKQVEFFDGFGHGSLISEIGRGIKPQERNWVKEYFEMTVLVNRVEGVCENP